jgi:hypothetical protein
VEELDFESCEDLMSYMGFVSPSLMRKDDLL